jgi:iron-sulfur cluster repair protein YtfE (RIC family)
MLLERRSCGEAAPRFAELHCGLGRHIEMEEQILLPAFETITGVAGNPMAIIYTEHENAHRAMGAIAALLRAGDRAGALAAVESLHELLRLHNLKEERLLYLTSDRLAGGERERVDLVRWMQAI